jgi:hypothetical protein
VAGCVPGELSARTGHASNAPINKATAERMR